ncbi:hypothetical protein CYMTET_11932 [Cymbomonas tetramitiformis]|uniref:Uncharacterized protein n=1 Tax=Cymbomonas tetramitiformis TaxID=36881 RepID=A0AAE0GLE3_9CHLO|nr:hypothetical protein CYMTET_11932 [Cymbomonas tetramitiformis]
MGLQEAEANLFRSQDRCIDLLEDNKKHTDEIERLSGVCQLQINLQNEEAQRAAEAVACADTVKNELHTLRERLVKQLACSEHLEEKLRIEHSEVEKLKAHSNAFDMSSSKGRFEMAHLEQEVRPDATVVLHVLYNVHIYIDVLYFEYDVKIL